MNTTNNTVLITGGSAGIGFEIAKQLSEKGNKVIITGRDEKRLQEAAGKLENATGIVSDVTKEADAEALVQRLQKDFPSLNMVINNAGRAIVYNIGEENNLAFLNAQDEMLTNYLSVVRLNGKLLPILKKQSSAAIVNVSSVVAFVPGVVLATYAASKAALHSYSKSLRVALEETNVSVFELMPPLVDTEFSAEIGGRNGIPPSQVAARFLTALEKDEFEIHVGNTEDMYRLYL